MPFFVDEARCTLLSPVIDHLPRIGTSPATSLIRSGDCERRASSAHTHSSGYLRHSSSTGR